MKLSERYHPERYRISRPFSRQATAIYESREGTAGVPSMKTLEAMTDLVIATYNREVENLPFEQRPQNTSAVMRECSLITHYAAFCATGRQIFHFTDEIAEQFRKTDVDDIPIETLKFPYSVFYMSFGRQPDLDLYNEERYVDGAYINVIENNRLQILLTTVGAEPLFSAGRFDWFLRPDRYYYLAIPLSIRSQSIAALAESALQEDLQRKREALPKGNPTNVFGRAPGAVRHTNGLYSDLKDLQTGYSTFKEALRLIINGLCYLSAYQEDIEVSWPEDTPSSILDKIRVEVKPKDIRRAISKLASMGFTKIHYCGREFERLRRSNNLNEIEIRPHWRRGHWRNQPFGPANSQRKLVWIMPVLVRKDKEGSVDKPGHIYLVE